MGCTWCKSRNRVAPAIDRDTPCSSQDSSRPNAWESDANPEEEQNTSGTSTVSHNTNNSYNDGGEPQQPITADACVETDFVYVHNENYKDKYETVVSERLQEAAMVEDQRVQMNETHAVELDLAVRRAKESTRMECQQEIDNYKKQVREENQKIIAESDTERKKHLEIIESLRTEIKGGVKNQPSTRPSKSKQISERLSAEYPTYTRDDFKTVHKEVRKQHGELSNKSIDFIIEKMREVISARQIVVDSNNMSPHPTNQQQQTVTFTSNESPTSNNIVVEETVPAPVATDNKVRIEIKRLLNSWDNNGYLSEIEEHTATVTGDTVQQLTTALIAYEQSTHDYLQKLQGKKSYKIMLAKSYAIFAWIAKHICYDYDAKESNLAGTLTAEQRSLDHILKNRSAICQGYSELFHAFSQEAGLETKIISGHSKSSSAKEVLNSGHYQSFSPEPSNSHAWNAVKILDTWFPVDCTHGSGDHSLDAKKKALLRTPNPFYFATPPEELIYTHMPESDCSQFLEPPLSLQAFKYRIAPSDHYFQFGIVAEEQKEFLSLEHNHVLQLNFSNVLNAAPYAEIIPVQPGGGDENNINADGHLTFFKDSGNGYVILNVILPDTGLYCIKLYGCIKKWEDEGGINSNSALILVYFVQTIKPPSVNHATLGYPAVEPIAANEVQLNVLEWNSKEPHIAESDGNIINEMTIKFQCSKETEIIHCLMNKTSGEESHHYTCVQQIDNDGTLTKYNLNVIFPEEGLWDIKLYRKLPNGKNRLLMKYCVHAAIGLPDQCYPVIESDKILLSACEKIHSPKPPNGFLKIPFRTTSVQSFTGYICKLPKSSDGQDKRLCDPTHVSEEGTNKYQLNAVFPHPGRWEVGVRIRKCISENKVLLSDAFSVISVVDNTQCSSHIYPQLSQNAVKFKVTIPNEPIIVPINQHDPICIEFTTPLDLIFSHHIVDTSESNDTPLEAYTFLNTPDNKNLPYHLNAVLPYEGDWLIQLFAKDDDKKSSSDLVLSLHVNNLAADFPGNVFYGFPWLHPSSTYQTRFKLLEWNKPGEQHVAESKTGTMEITFSVKQDVDIVHYMVKGKQEDNINQRLHKFTYLTSTDAVNEGSVNRKQTLKIIIPEKGHWTIFLLQVKPCSLGVLMEYTVYATVAVEGKCFPITTSKFDMYGLKIPPNTIPYSSIYSLPATVTIKVYCPDLIELKAIANHRGEELDASIIKLSNTHQVTVKINQCGQWIIKLYAAEQNCTTMQLVLSHEILTTQNL